MTGFLRVRENIINEFILTELYESKKLKFGTKFVKNQDLINVFR